MTAKKIMCIACLILCSLIAINFSAGEASAEEKNKAPDFFLKDVNGKDLILSSYKGKVVILSFWATWCPSCRDEMPKFNKLYNEMKSRGIEILAVSSDYSVGSLKDYLYKNNFDFRIAYDEKRAVTKQYKVPYLPVTFLIDRNGFIAEKVTGEFEWPSAEMKTKIEKLLQ